MDLKEFILNLYRKGYSISYIEKMVLKKYNKSYIYVTLNSNIINKKIDCRKLVEDTIIEYLKFK